MGFGVSPRLTKCRKLLALFDPKVSLGEIRKAIRRVRRRTPQTPGTLRNAGAAATSPDEPDDAYRLRRRDAATTTDRCRHECGRPIRVTAPPPGSCGRRG